MQRFGSFTGLLSTPDAPVGTLRRQVEMFSDLPLISVMLDGIPDAACVLNVYRQIVFANAPLLAMLGQSSPEPLLGRRLGDVLRCPHAPAADGCGTAEACRDCGIARGLFAAIHGDKATEECHITPEPPGPELVLRIHLTPFEVALEKFTLVAFARPGA